MYPEKIAVAQIVEIIKAKGITDVVISPGSRNAPFIIAFSKDPSFNCFSVIDERSAAFFAIGRAIKTNNPVIVLCTSGSALLNYYPAVAEALYQEIPLFRAGNISAGADIQCCGRHAKTQGCFQYR